ncbi:MAG: hypothetical protein WCS03_12010 [Bacteroidota bacterium]
MKKKLQILFSSLVLFLLLLVGCNKDSELHDSYYAELQSDELLKIETIYKEGDVKIEGVNAIKTLETDASQAYKDKVNAELEASYSKQVSYVKNGGNLVAVFEYASCGSYSRIHINMDAEDGDGSYYQGFTGNSYVTYPYYNVNG